MQKKLMLIDGNSMLFRAYYATSHGLRMTNGAGVPTGAIFGFVSMLQKALEQIGPEYVCVAFDAGKHTFRHDLYPDYKGGRAPVPDDLVPQFGMVRDLLDAYHMKWVQMPEIEADDLIGSLSLAAGDDYFSYILTSDHDLLQLVDDTTSVVLMKKGLTDLAIMTPEAVQEEMGITPKQVIDFKGIAGDTSDHYSGIPGIGEKGAVKLIQQYGSVEEILAHADEISGAVGRKVREGKESAVLCKMLATIKRDVPLDFTAEDCLFTPDYDSLITFLRSLNMNSLVSHFQELAQKPQEQTEQSGEQKFYDREVPEEFLKNRVGIYIDADDGYYDEVSVHGIALSDGRVSYYVSWEKIKEQPLLVQFLSHKGTKIGFDVKRDMHLFDRIGISFEGDEDAMIAAFLSDSTLTDTKKMFAAFALNDTFTYEDVYGKKNKPKIPDPEQVCGFACMRAMNILKLYDLAKVKVEQIHLWSLYEEMEMPLTEVLYRMEKTGIRCDEGILDEIGQRMQEEISKEEKAIYGYAGYEFNINSVKQLSSVLYDQLGLYGGKKRSTAADQLEKLKDAHPIVPHILNYRRLAKLNSTYAEGLKKYIRPDSRIHTIFNQTIVQTGRLSSSDPNLQNISVRDEEGKTIRKAFLPDPGCVLLSSDYHQIELRILAHMADEPSLIEAFREGIDIHTKTAMDIFGVSQDEVTPVMRRQAKTVNFGIVYGISDFGLAEQLGVSRQEANDFITRYYKQYPRIQTFMDGIVSFCEKNGYVETICGRRREIPEIKDKNRMVHEFGKRAAMNAPVQGSAADLIKLAMIRIQAIMDEKQVRSQMILQVHDELIFNVPEDEIDLMKELVTDGMEHAMDLKVPLSVELSIGKDWYEAK